jgi:uncharacterized membrane protein YbhN (UPF0104 family)
VNNKKLKEALKIIIFFSLGLFVTFWVYGTMSIAEKDEFWLAISGANYLWLLLSILIGTLAHYVRALRWKLIIEPFGYKPKNYNLFFAVMNMYFFNAMVPRLGEVTRCALLRNYEKIPVEKSLGTVVAERAVDLFCFACFLGLIALFNWETYAQAYDAIQLAINQFVNGSGPQHEPGFLLKNWKFLVLGSGVFVFALLFLFRKNRFISKIYTKVLNLIKGFWEGLKSTLLIKRKGLFGLYTLCIWGLYFIMTYVCFFALPGRNITTDPFAPFAVMIFGSFAIMATPNGLGVFPVVVAVILNLPEFGSLDRGTGNALGWIIWGTQEIMILAVGVIVMILIPVFNRNHTPVLPS